jgi:predicted RNase H-like HicB family nuclease
MGVGSVGKFAPAIPPSGKAGNGHGALSRARAGSIALRGQFNPETGGAETMKFVIVIQPAEDGSWWVRVPELPGCFSAGATRAEAAENAREAIEGHIAVLRQFGDLIPDGLEGGSVAEIVEVLEAR